MRDDLYRTILETVEDGVYFVDPERRITFWNAGAEHITGYSSDEVMHHSCSDDILRHVSEGGDQLCLHGCPLAGVMSDGRPRAAKVYLHHKNGHRVPVLVKARPLYDDAGEIVGSVEVFTRRKANQFADVSERERQENAFIDPLTDLGNRRFGEAHLKPMMDAVVSGDSTLGLVFIDVDKFKQINDSLGHHAGDMLLRMVGQTLANGLRVTDMVASELLTFPNIAVIPVNRTLGALELGTLLSGAVLTEQVFTIPGFGKLVIDAVFNRDYAVVQGVVLFTATSYIVINLLVDVAYALANPKIQVG